MKPNWQTIHTGGITYLEPLRGSKEWYWGTDYTDGDLYEAAELFADRHPLQQNRLIFVHRPSGRVVEPITARPGQYFGRPAADAGRPVILLADFPADALRLLSYDHSNGAVTLLVELPLAVVEDCYNLMPGGAPLLLTRQKGCRFQIVWPLQADFAIDAAESFCCRDGDLLYFSRWYEDPNYREEVVVRQLDGKIAGRFPGSLQYMADGQNWLLV